jgi:RimJ/RimL family protein N-acetyltransferase
MSLHDRVPVGGLSNGRVGLRMVAPSDAEWLRRASADAEVVRWTDIPDDFSPSDVSSWIAKRQRGWEGGWRASFLIEAPRHEPVSYLSVRMDWGRSIGDLGYWLLADSRGHGIVTDAVRLARDWAFNDLELCRVQAAIQPNNEQSLAVMGRVGFTREGLLRSSDVLKGQHHDHWMFSLLQTDERI